jgi:cytochrome c556
MKKHPLIASLSAVLILSSASIANQAFAQEKAESAKEAKNVITFRQSLFQLIRSNIGPLGAMAKGKMPYDPELMAKNAERMMQLSAMIPDYLSTNTSMYEVGTDAKEEIWQNWDDFNTKAQALYDASAALKAVVDAKDEGKYRSAIGKVGASCKACHDDYKAD